MSKQWISLLVLGFVIVGIVVAWDIYLTVSGLKGDFFYTTNPIPNSLYEKVGKHFEALPDFDRYEQAAKQTESIDDFR